MALTDNYGTQYYGISCGIASDAGLNVNANSGTKYYRNSANEFILWGQGTQYTHVQANTGSQFYFLKCAVPSDVGVNLTRNHGTNYYYSSAFNCVSFCDPINFVSSESNAPITIIIPSGFGVVLQPDGSYVIQPDGSYVFYPL